MTPKQHILQAIEELPDESSYEEILRERRANLPLDLGVEPPDELGHASRNA